MQLRELDWAAPLRGQRFAKHWRLLVCQLLLSIPAAGIWNAYSPHTFWFHKLWAGLVTGALVGLIPGGYWQLRDPKRRAQTSGRFLVFGFIATAVFAAVAALLMAPDLDSQERQRALIRSLSAADISELFIQIDDRPALSVRDAASIASLAALTRDAELFYPNHEGSKFDFRLEIHCQNGAVLEYRGRVPERHIDDISLDFHGYFGRHAIIVPGGRLWLEEANRARGNTTQWDSRDGIQ